ncbi:MAG: DCC1-like thiol-disulfide oxidoreductase family protein [Pseudomonadota bacterium]|nr:DCC1-like thiol-disulfide oxidoreductase family protein [Pseudomonadota bacterium]
MHALGWPWRLCWLLWLIPAPVRNGLYRFVARNRYRFLAAATRASSHAQ